MAPVSGAWVTVLAVGAATVAIKAAGPLLLGGRPLPDRVAGMVGLLAPTLLAALVATAVLADGRRLVVDARVVGLVAAAIALRFRAPLLVVIVVAAAATATVRAFA
jgi:branched-subunit amino acid transport protein